MMSAPHQEHVSLATYPIPEPLIRRLQAGVELPNVSNANRVVDDPADALAHLVGNAIEAMDAMYFGTPPRIRQHAAFEHRLCLRVHTDEDSLTVTDLGAGMTRADLINSLGTGKALATAMVKRESADWTESTQEEDDDDESGEDEGSTNGENGNHHAAGEERPDDQTSEEEEEEPETKPAATATGTPVVLSCRATEIGGFYAALCSLGTAVRVGTKSKHDDYYVFEMGLWDAATDPATAFDQFRIARPHPEGTELTVETGFDQFAHVRGESGTSVTIKLNASAVAAGLLDEEKLKPMFLKIVETTQYTVAFSSDAEAASIIAASAQEKQALETLMNEPDEPVDPLDAVADMELGDKDGAGSHNSVKERAKYIPLRLSLGERKMLRLVEAAMNCCDYTTEVDRPFKSSARRTHEQLKGVTSILRGIVTACTYEDGQKLLHSDNFAAFESVFRKVFEIARRHKIMNPEKMRTEYGKLIYILQDAVSPTVKPHLGFSVNAPIESVYKFLEERNGLDVLSDKLIETATQEILAGKKARATIDMEIRQKERAVAQLKRKYRSNELSADDIHLCLYSICDNNSFLNSNRVPVDKIIDFLTSHFSPTTIEEGYSLAIVSGEDGARLSHSHQRQYYFALQSLTLWRDIIDDMFRLWAMAEEDLLSESVSYSLQDTGQGMQRVQQSPRTYKAMQQILVRVQKKVSHWIGSSVIHMGDHNVPNALSFIDKYTQGM